MVVLGCILLAFAGISKAVKDKVNFHYTESIFVKYNAQYWSSALSWRNKYLDGIKKRGPKFFGSTTFLVWTTDAWHLFQLLEGLFLAIGFSLIGFNLWLILGYVINRTIFELFFKYIFKKK